jgi:predicted kinase
MLEVYDWDRIERTFPYVPAMRTCIQDPIHHAEGDVWTHTRMVVEALSQFDGTHDRELRLTGLYHDIHKPKTRTVEHDPELGREVVRHPNHSRLGAMAAWHDLWMSGEELRTRLAVYWLCRWHQKVFHIWREPDMIRAALSFAMVGSWEKLIQFARADNAGRICANPNEASDNLDLLEQWLSEHKIGPEFFATDHDRIFFFEKAGRSPYYAAQKPQGSRVVILSGLPGAGKDTYYNTTLHGLPMVSLDLIRDDLDIDPEDNQGRVIQAAFEQARVFLREKKPFVWNAQTVTRMARDKIIRLCRDYDAHVSIHALNRPYQTIVRGNRLRKHQVPQKAIDEAAVKWEPPSLLEAHQVLWV